MRNSVDLFSAPDAVALCGSSNIALFDKKAKRITEWAYTKDGTLVATQPFMKSDFQNIDLLSKSRWSKWRMAENHPVVCALSTTGALCVLRPGGYKEMPAINAQRILQVDPKGKWALLQSRQDILKVSLENGGVLETHRLTLAMYQTEGATAWIAGGVLHVEMDKITTKAALPVTAWIPTDVHVGKNNTVYVFHTKRKNTTLSVQLHVWKMSTQQQLQCAKVVTFDDPCFSFCAVGKNERWCCEWPRKNGFVVQDADGHGNSITCAFPPVTLGNTTAYVTPRDKRLFFNFD